LASWPIVKRIDIRIFLKKHYARSRTVEPKVQYYINKLAAAMRGTEGPENDKLSLWSGWPGLRYFPKSELHSELQLHHPYQLVARLAP